MRTFRLKHYFLTFVFFCLINVTALSQSISGFSTVSEVRQRSSRLGVATSTILQGYTDTEEDYTASLYYNVGSNSALFYEGNQTASA